jgi:flagellar hook assembly protein FlgD
MNVNVYDVAGRHVRRLFQGPKATGSHRIAWDGREDSGAMVSAGVYLVRLETSGRVEHTKRIVRLR